MSNVNVLLEGRESDANSLGCLFAMFGESQEFGRQPLAPLAKRISGQGAGDWQVGHK
jgi:hypothetical protein